MKILFRLILFTLLSLSLGSAQAAELTFSWTPNSESNLGGYKIYYGEASRTYTEAVDVGNPAAIDGKVSASVTVPDGKTLYFAATAYDVDKLESDYSDEVVVTTPEVIIPPDITPILDANSISIDFPDSRQMGNLYVGTTDKDITVSWPSVAGAVSYSYRFYDLNKKIYALSGTVTSTHTTIRLPRTGLYQIEIKADNMAEWITAPNLISGWVAGAGSLTIQ